MSKSDKEGNILRDIFKDAYMKLSKGEATKEEGKVEGEPKTDDKSEEGSPDETNVKASTDECATCSEDEAQAQQEAEEKDIQLSGNEADTDGDGVTGMGDVDPTNSQVEGLKAELSKYKSQLKLTKKLLNEAIGE